MSLDIKATIEGPTIKVSVSEFEDGCQFAFYVYRGAKRFHTQKYGASSKLDFDTNGTPGYYRVLAFVRRGSDPPLRMFSNPVFANPVCVTASDLPEPGSDRMVYNIHGYQWTFPTLYYPGARAHLFVLLSAAVNRNHVELPVFNRWTWAEQSLFPGETLCIADPTLSLHPNLRIGWYLGTRSSDLLDELATIITKFAISRSIPRDNIIVWGSSAGGFAALSLATRIATSTAVAINSQTNPLSYEKKDQVELMRRVCFDALSDEAIRQQHPLRIDARSFFTPDARSRAILVQNKNDTHQHKDHFLPFWNSLGGAETDGWAQSSQHLAFVYEGPHAHVAESYILAQQILTKSCR